MIHMERTMTIDRTRPAVFDYIASLENLPAYIGPINRISRVSTPQLAPGTRLTVEAHFLGIRFSQRAELLEYERPRRLVARSVGGRFRFEAGFELQASRGQAILQGWGRAEAPRLFPLAETIVAFLIERQIDGDLKRLKRTLEDPA